MLKINYEARPFYSGIGLDEPCTKHLEIEFAEDATIDEVLGEFIKSLYYAGYSRINVEYFERLKDELLENGVIDE